MARENLAFIGRSYQPLLSISVFTLDPPCGPRVSLGETRKPTRLMGRSVALLTRLHPKCPFQVKLLRVRAFLTLLPSTGVLRSSRTIWMADQTGQYGTFPIPTGIRVPVVPIPVDLALRWRSERTARLRPHVRPSPCRAGAAKAPLAQRWGPPQARVARG